MTVNVHKQRSKDLFLIFDGVLLPHDAFWQRCLRKLWIQSPLQENNESVRWLLFFSNFDSSALQILSPLWLSSKESACNAEDQCLIPGSGRSPEGGHGYPLHYSCLDNPMDIGAWQATAHRVTKSQT